ncbi:MAG: glutamine--fructose-6-phosphate transaminase (isomerizing) [Candidatus Eremiobacter antarcticus]|nr:glutamine--fructose-6-phosphate transaminase (isomerizing) [Candidatus Eremiobacteraeota bacterium]MBC5807696.1 glutamine--fructose-6-phosphate transaminase (isomerizing) [Candidatus Eremiobacteraeota bacterium]PZR60484.1 MAG: glutamine--fructose-6-phosphate transaminase (isomerizing) [Candidatus Eremiobacter sp. RRmetagenome_bin22]
MCGIVGYVGPRDVVGVLMDGLRRLEYRGYDSAGVAVVNGGSVIGSKRVGKLGNLAEVLRHTPIHGSAGIGHTRWATHGRPSDSNAHPHLDCKGRIAVIHNGIIENYASLRDDLLRRGHTFQSDTDTEVVAHLLEEFFDGDLVGAVRRTLKVVTGAYALGVLSADSPDRLVFARNGASPLIIGLGEGETFVASDIPAILNYTRRELIVQEGEVVEVTREGALISTFNGQTVDREVTNINWDIGSAEKSGFKHFMLKEIYEQPKVVKDTLLGRLRDDNSINLRELGLSDERLRGIRKVTMFACGSAYYAAAYGMYLIRQLAKLPVELELASEFRYSDPVLDEHTLAIAVSQSGETADTLEAVRIAKTGGATLLAICNVVGSALARAADATLFMQAGPEIGVAATKTFTAQCVDMALLAMHLGAVRGTADPETLQKLGDALRELPSLVDQALNVDDEVAPVARRISKATTMLFLGRHVDYPIAMEGALKLKEISYIHAEGYAAGEMKHGPIALLDENVPVVVLATRGPVQEKILSNMSEAKARDSRIIAVANLHNDAAIENADVVFAVPETHHLIQPIINVVPLYLLAYHIADHKGCDVDQPRNLAKTVTVE